MDGSDGESSAVHFALDELFKLLPADHLISISSNRVDNLNELVIIVAVFELLINVAQVIEIKLTLALNIQQ